MQNSVVERRLYFNTGKLRFGALHNSRTTVNIETETNAFQVNAHLQSLQLWDRLSSHHSRKQPWEINIRLNPKQASRWNKGRNSPVNIWSIIKHLLPSLKQGITVLRQVDRHFEPVQRQWNWSEKRRTSGLEPGMSQSLSRATRETREGKETAPFWMRRWKNLGTRLFSSLSSRVSSQLCNLRWRRKAKVSNKELLYFLMKQAPQASKATQSSLTPQPCKAHEGS